MRCSRNDVVLLPIPFTDLSSAKVRPAIVVGHGSFPGDLFLVPVTSRVRQSDFELKHWRKCGLNVASGVKAQIATVDEHLVRMVVGRLSGADIAMLDSHLRQWLELR